MFTLVEHVAREEEKQMTFGEWLLRKRTSRVPKMSQEELGNRAGCSTNYISVLENNTPHSKTGALPSPTREKVKAIIAALELSKKEEEEGMLAAGFAPDPLPVLAGYEDPSLSTGCSLMWPEVRRRVERPGVGAKGSPQSKQAVSVCRLPLPHLRQDFIRVLYIFFPRFLYGCLCLFNRDPTIFRQAVSVRLGVIVEGKQSADMVSANELLCRL